MYICISPTNGYPSGMPPLSTVPPRPTTRAKVRITPGTYDRWVSSDETTPSSAAQHVAEALALLDSLGLESVSIEEMLATARFVRDSRGGR